MIDYNAWWSNLQPQWKKAFNETMLGNGAVEDQPSNDEVKEIFECPNFRFAGPKAFHPNMSFELTNLTGLEEMHQAELISVTFHQVVSLQPLAKLTGLKSLFINDNQVFSLEGIEKMTELKMLYATDNEIQSLVPMKNLKKLEFVQLGYNKLDSFEGLNENNTKHIEQFVGLPNRVAQTEINRLQNELRVRILKA